MNIVHINKNGEIIKDINGTVIRLPEFYQVLNRIQEKRKKAK